MPKFFSVLLLSAGSISLCCLVAIRHVPPSGVRKRQPGISTSLTTEAPQEPSDKLTHPADFIAAERRVEYLGFTIEKIVRKAPLESKEKNRPTWVAVEYVVVKKNGKTLKKFDADVYFGLGNSAGFGLFPFRNDGSKQIFISQDIYRGGCQWIVSLSPRFEVLFNGQEFSVGREGPDLSAFDLDKDGVYEISAPITDFYSFHDKMSMSDIPLPSIIFKYDPTKRKYMPANHRFKDYALQNLEEVPAVDESLQSHFLHRGAVLSNLLTYIYAGEQTEGWHFFDKQYELNDKNEIRRRVKQILRDQPVYNLIYADIRKTTPNNQR